MFPIGIANAANIVYPKSKNVTINAPSTFFTGNENPANRLTINSEEITLSKNGGFFYPVDLNLGENIFVIDNGKEKKTYKITRNQVPQNNVPKEIKYFEEPLTVALVKDNVPLRSFPYDGGMTRLQHFDKGIPFTIIGEYNGFYKVQLARDDYAWIDKNSTADVTGYNNSPANIENFSYEETPQKRMYSVKLNKKVPYILTEGIKYKTDSKMKHFLYTADGLDLIVYNVKNYPDNKYEIHLNKTGFSTGYKSYYKNNNELIIEIKNAPAKTSAKPLSGLKITLDAGHGGTEFGAAGCLGNYEKDLNLQIAQKLKKYLEGAGAVVYMTREDDTDLDLNSRVQKSQENNSDIFLSIHNDSLGDGSKIKNPSGSTAYIYYPQASELAESIITELNKQTGLKNNGVKEQSFAVVRNTESLSVLLEVGYMISPKDSEKLITPEFQELTAKSIAKGIVNYVNAQKQ